jgi:hypothetical protein
MPIRKCCCLAASLRLFGAIVLDAQINPYFAAPGNDFGYALGAFRQPRWTGMADMTGMAGMTGTTDKLMKTVAQKSPRI